MMMNDYLKGLNPEQRQAVTFPLDKPLKVLAGAGTGKTRLLTTRYIHILAQDVNCGPENILALTFTNKAAAEMKERIVNSCRELEIAPGPHFLSEAWIGTFHSFCHRFLRQHALRAGIDPEFTVYDEARSWLLYQRVLDNFLSHKKGVPEGFALTDLNFYGKDVYFLINRLKDSLIYPQDYQRMAINEGNRYYERWRELLVGLENIKLHPATRKALVGRGGEALEQRAWERDLIEVTSSLFFAYQKALTEAMVLDFADLIYYTYRLLRDQAAVRKECHRQFAYILVDEFQDTNRAQFALLHLLARDEKMSNVTVVGDERQAIYGWRNARIENVREFRAYDWGGKEIKLYTNYRSYQQILDVAQFSMEKSPYLVQNNLPLRAHRGLAPEPRIRLYGAQDREEEGRMIATAIDKLLKQGIKSEDIVILLRSPRWAKPYENALRQRGIPFQTIGGVGFYDREEIKDLLAYLRVVINPYDDLSLVRVLRAPPNFFNDADLARICQGQKGRKGPGGEKIYLYDILGIGLEEPEIPRTVKEKVKVFLALREKFAELKNKMSLREFLNQILERTAYLDYVYTHPPDEVQRQIANIRKLFSLASQGDLGTATELIGYTELFAKYDLREGEEALPRRDFVTLMSVHQAKGLEFPYVFLPNLTDTNFPVRARHPNLDFGEEGGLMVKRDQLDREMAKFAPRNYDKDNYRDVYNRFGIVSYRDQQWEEQQQEERRLFYVALTRAQEGLYLSCPRPFPKRSRGPHFFQEIWEGYDPVERVVGQDIEGMTVAENFLPDWKPAELQQYHKSLSDWLELQKRVPLFPGGTPLISLSVSQVETYRQCPRCFYLRHGLRLPEEGKGGIPTDGFDTALLGSLLHRVLEVYHREKWKPKKIGQLVELQAQVIGLPEPLRPIYLAPALEILAQYLRCPLSLIHPEPEDLERRFKILLTEEDLRVELTGIIDRIHRDKEGRWVLIDYKSNYSISREQWEEYKRQLHLYALAFEQLFPQRGTPYLYIYHLPPGELLSVDYSPQHLGAARKNLLNTASAIGANRFPFRIGPHCRWCGYQKYCGRNPGMNSDKILPE